MLGVDHPFLDSSTPTFIIEPIIIHYETKSAPAETGAPKNVLLPPVVATHQKIQLSHFRELKNAELQGHFCQICP